jgi:N-6 DNA methylase
VLANIAERLSSGSKGRTEADLQADVRSFLLAAPLDLAVGQIDVSLEAPAGAGRRIDVEAGCVVIEVKKSLGSKSVFDQAVEQLAGYVRTRTEETAQRFVGVLTDGRSWHLFHLTPSGSLAPVDLLEVRGRGDADRLSAWLEVVLATTDRIRPTPQEIVRRLGADSPAAQLDLADLRALYRACRSDPEVQLKRELWGRLLVSSLGTSFEDSDEMFVTHTYLVLVAELIAHEIMKLPIDAPNGDVRALLEGQQFAMAGLHGVVEADFFDWPAVVEQGRPIVLGIARRLATFDWSDVEHDVLKALYQSVIDRATRRKLGEYYTPDWLAQKIVDEQFRDPLRQRLLDPACGSGTFLFWGVRRCLSACEEARLPTRAALERVVAHVQGLDLHPVAVTLARVTYLLAITRERLGGVEEFTVPVFLGDSVQWQQAEMVRTEGGLTVSTADRVAQLVDDSLHFPEGVLRDPQRFDRLVEALARRAGDRSNTRVPGIAGLLRRHRVVGEEDRRAVVTAFKKLCRLHDAGRDHLWSYYIRNMARPLSFLTADGQVDVLVGNPPWLSYRSMSRGLQASYRALAEERGLWSGGKVATHQDMSDVFVVRAVEQYLRPRGGFAFVMPFAVLSRRQFEGFRGGDWNGASARFSTPEDLSRVKPPPFPAASCVVSGTKHSVAASMPERALTWRGRLPAEQLDWPALEPHLKRSGGDVAVAVDSSESPYRSRFRQGATLVPRMLVMVERAPDGPLGVPHGHRHIRSSRSSNEKQPWKNLPTLTGVVEEQFVRPVHLGETIVAYRARSPRSAVIPMPDDGSLLDGESEDIDEFPRLAAWWREAERVWETNKSPASQLSLRDQLDFQSKLTKQRATVKRVVYTASGQHIAACAVDGHDAVIAHSLYWVEVSSVDEGRYLCSILNSGALMDAVAGLQARGQHNPRHFDMHVFALPFPLFEPRNALHVHLARLAERAELVAAAVDLDDAWQFQKARRVVREALREDGIASEIDRAVDAVVAEAMASRCRSRETPPVLDALSPGEDRSTRKPPRTGVDSPHGPARHH